MTDQMISIGKIMITLHTKTVQGRNKAFILGTIMVINNETLMIIYKILELEKAHWFRKAINRRPIRRNPDYHRALEPMLLLHLTSINMQTPRKRRLSSLLSLTIIRVGSRQFHKPSVKIKMWSTHTIKTHKIILRRMTPLLIKVNFIRCRECPNRHLTRRNIRL